MNAVDKTAVWSSHFVDIDVLLPSISSDIVSIENYLARKPKKCLLCTYTVLHSLLLLAYILQQLYVNI